MRKRIMYAFWLIISIAVSSIGAISYGDDEFSRRDLSPADWSERALQAYKNNDLVQARAFCMKAQEGASILERIYLMRDCDTLADALGIEIDTTWYARLVKFLEIVSDVVPSWVLFFLFSCIVFVGSWSLSTWWKLARLGRAIMWMVLFALVGFMVFLKDQLLSADYALVVTEAAGLYAGIGKHCAQVALLKKGTEVRVKECKEVDGVVWCKIHSHLASGWVEKEGLCLTRRGYH